MRFSHRMLVLVAALVFLPAVGLGAEWVNESAREIPVAYRVDVVVVGGSTGAVSAAVAAAESGAKVFLAAAPPYLGEDMTATLRLWLEPGEHPASPLAKQIFLGDRRESGADPNAIPFSYKADRPSAKTHRDADPPSLLSDGAWGRASTQSVQFDDDVTITAELREPQPVERVRAVFYRRASGGATDFDVASIVVSASDDQKTWKPVATLGSEQFKAPDETGGDDVMVAVAPVGAKARYVRLAFKRPAGVSRMLLGEIEIIGTAPAVAAKPVEQIVTPVRPMHVKKTLDEALLGAGVEFLYGCYPTDVLRDQQGQLCGIVMANRAGRQAVLAKTIIDATDRAAVARMAGARFREYPSGLHTLKRVVIGGEARTGADLQSRTISPPFRTAQGGAQDSGPGVFPIIEYTLRLPMKDASYGSWSQAEQKARGLTYHEQQQFASDRLFEVPPDCMAGQASVTAQSFGDSGGDLGKLPLEAFRPKGIGRLSVLGGCADVPRPAAERLLRPLALIDAGTRIGAAAAAEAKSLPAPSGVRVAGQPVAETAAAADVRESLVGVRPIQKLPTVPQPARALPVLGAFDVVVIGGGTGGAPASRINHHEPPGTGDHVTTGKSARRNRIDHKEPLKSYGA